VAALLLIRCGGLPARRLVPWIIIVLLVSNAGCGGPGIRPRLSPACAGGDASLPTDPVLLGAEADRLSAVGSSPADKEVGYRMACKLFQSTREDTAATRDAALLLARCAERYADWAPDKASKRSAAMSGMYAARAADPGGGDPAASYYYGLNLGIYINTIGLEALGLVGDLITHLETAGAAPEIEDGGPLRVLGILYVRAPAWPLGPGDLDRALELLNRAAEEYPSHPLNHLFLAEALIDDDDMSGASRELDAAESLSLDPVWGAYTDRWLREAGTLRKRIR